MPHQGSHRTSPSADADLLLSLATGRSSTEPSLASPRDHPPFSPGNSILARHRHHSSLTEGMNTSFRQVSNEDTLHHQQHHQHHHHSSSIAITTPSPLAVPGAHSSTSSSEAAAAAEAAANMHMSVHGNGSHRLMPSPIKLPHEEEEEEQQQQQQQCESYSHEKRVKRTVATDDIEEPSPDSTSRKIRRIRSPEQQDHEEQQASTTQTGRDNTVISPASSADGRKTPESKSPPSPPQSHHHHHHHHPNHHHHYPQHAHSQQPPMPYRPPYYAHWPYPYAMHPPPPYYAMPIHPHPEYTTTTTSSRTLQPTPPKEEPRQIGEDARCVPMEHPTQSSKVVPHPEEYDLKLPDFPQLVNFPEHLTRGQTRSAGEGTGPAPNGKRHCVMCGLLRISSSTANRVNRSNAPPSAADSTVHIIPRQNKGVCTACDVTVWIMNTVKEDYAEEDLEIKWCKGCKNFRPWPAFGDKGLATKCARCRHRQRTKYAQAKRTGSNNINHRDATNRYEYPPEDDIMAAQGLSNLSQQQVP